MSSCIFEHARPSIPDLLRVIANECSFGGLAGASKLQELLAQSLSLAAYIVSRLVRVLVVASFISLSEFASCWWCVWVGGVLCTWAGSCDSLFLSYS